jgi:hypothetical protein
METNHFRKRNAARENVKIYLKEIGFEVVDWIKLGASRETEPNKLCCGQFLDQLKSSSLISKDTVRMRRSEF